VPRPILREYGHLLGNTNTVDAIGIVARDHDGRGTHLSFPIAAGAPPVPSRALGQLSRLSAHLVSARRLRDALAPVGPDADSVDAVLDPSGRLLDARSDARERTQRERLSESVSRIERARGRLRRTDPDEALELWKALVGGAWSLVDHCERGGRRLILARRNRPGVQDPKSLAPRERDALAYAALGHSNKFIGYMLGLAPSTVAEHLFNAQRKLGVGSRRELIAVFAGSSAGATPPA
jgi:DNA-binding CsgD family transcriptional regulator